MLTRLRNADRAGLKEARMPYSKIKHAMLQVMAKNGYVQEVNIETPDKFQELHIVLADRKFSLNIKRISKPGQRIYVNASSIPKVLDGLGIAILSTPKGVMCGKDAKKSNIGGELLCEIS